MSGPSSQTSAPATFPGEAVDVAEPPSPPNGRRSSKRAAMALVVAALVAGLAVPVIDHHTGSEHDGNRVVAAGPSPEAPRRRTAGAAAISAAPDSAVAPVGATVPSGGGGAGARFAGTRSSGTISTRSDGSGAPDGPGDVDLDGPDVGAAAGGIASTYQDPSDGPVRSQPRGDGSGSSSRGGPTTTPVHGSDASHPEPPSPTTTLAPTTTVAPTTTATPAACPRGVIEPERSSFVFDGQSNSLYPTPEQSYGAKLMRIRWPARMQYWALVAVGGTSFDQRAGWAPDRVDREIARLGQPCAVLIQEGGPTDFAEGLTAAEVLQANQRYTQARRAAGFDVIVGATTPPLGLITAAQDAQRRAYNDLLRKYWRQVGLDHLVDVAALPQLQDVHDARWFSDATHFTDEATSVVAELYARTLP